MFIENAFNEETQFWYFSVVLTVIVSIVLHELAHGWAAIREGDDTPIETGHMTGNPMIHMGGLSIALVFLFGIAWGAMPVNPSRFRGKYSDAIVSFAGPAMNFLLAFVALTILGLLFQFWPDFYNAVVANNDGREGRISELLVIAGYYNIALGIFNLAPIPPLDGSRILADFHSGYRNWLRENTHLYGGMFMMYLLVVSMSGNSRFGLFRISNEIAYEYLGLFMP